MLEENDYKYLHLKMSRKNFKVELTLSRPEKLNALNFDILEELADAIRCIESDKKIHFVILKGSGEKAFCAGADLQEKSAFTKSTSDKYLDLLNSIACEIEDSKKIYIAAIDGIVLGGGLELALACDFRIATRKSKFGFPEVKIGAIPAGGGTVRIASLCGLSIAKEVVLLGEKFGAEKAYEYRILNEVVPDKKALDAKVTEFIQVLKKSCYPALIYAKKSLGGRFRKDRSKLLRTERECFAKLLGSKELEDALKPFE